MLRFFRTRKLAGLVNGKSTQREQSEVEEDMVKETPSGIEIHPLTAELLDDYLSFFDKNAFADNPDWQGCYCYFPYHDAAEGAWSERTGVQNRAAISQGILSGEVQGFLAFDGERVVGWCNAAPRSFYPALASLPGNSAACGATPCFLIDPQYRRRGIAGKLLAAACAGFVDRGLAKMEAGPKRDAEGPQTNSRGPLSLYVAAGYREVVELPDGTVVVEKTL